MYLSGLGSVQLRLWRALIHGSTGTYMSRGGYYCNMDRPNVNDVIDDGEDGVLMLGDVPPDASRALLCAGTKLSTSTG